MVTLAYDEYSCLVFFFQNSEMSVSQNMSPHANSTHVLVSWEGFETNEQGYVVRWETCVKCCSRVKSNCALTAGSIMDQSRGNSCDFCKLSAMDPLLLFLLLKVTDSQFKH